MDNSVRNPEWIQGLIAARKPGYSLEQAFYCDPEIYTHDLEQIVLRHWLYAGHTSQLPNAGDYFLYDVAHESIIVTRDKNGEVHALFNVCRHRGSRVCLEESGNARAFTCPYHSWTYAPDGHLLAARHMSDDFDKSAFSLHRCHVRVLEGLIFISLAEEPPEFDSVENDVLKYLQLYGLADTRICHRKTDIVQANWKLLMENYYECYHCTTAHPEFASVNTHVRAQDSPKLAQEDKAFQAAWEARVRELGQPLDRVVLTPETYHYCGRGPIRPGFVTQTQDGAPAAPLLGGFREYDGGLTGITILLFSLVATNDYVAIIRFTPLGPTTTKSEVSWHVHKDAVESREYDVDRITWLWRKTFDQDYKICEDNQAGINSSRYRPGPYSKVEGMVDTFVQWYLRQIE